ncbi:MAG: tripartite tricarboxylate transporter permease [Actinomycetota bacterium]|nr:tripartite tricarboxylate transporter permease [Actinomycetota bacterium]
MDFFSPVLQGFTVALAPQNLFYVFIGCLIGMVIGVLPGLGPVPTIALLLPLTYTIEPASAVIMLAGIYYGAMYGGTVTSVLLRLPGEAASVVTTFDGYQMAKQGRAGPALGIAAIGSFIGGTVSVVGLTLVAPLLAGAALRFGPPEYTVLALIGILLVASIGSGSKIKALLAAAAGLLLATVGQDPVVGAARFTFGNLNLQEGLDFVILAMGLFGIAEILHSLEHRMGSANLATSSLGRKWPSMVDWAQSRGSIARGSVLGFLIGLLPGGSGTLSSMASYALEKRRSKTPERFGRGAIEGVAGPETANNAGVTAAFIPLLTLGIPANAVMALMFGALLLQGITPGPQLITSNPEVFWGVVDSMYIGNLFLLVLSIPLVGLFIRLVAIRETVLAPIVMMITMIGVYTIRNNPFDMFLVIGFGVLGYLMKKAGFDPGPLVLAFVLGRILETSFRQSLRIFNGDLLGFVQRPISGTLLLLIVLAALIPLVLRRLRGGRGPLESLLATPADGPVAPHSEVREADSVAAPRDKS